MILSGSVECIIYDVQSLKEKRSVLKKIIARIQNRYNIVIAEVDHQNVWQRTKLVLVTVGSSRTVAEQELQKGLALIDSFPEIERTETVFEWF
ncbi:hypothetical protein B4064_0741 [Caldibacillus thermoamylovorans]|jgi:uncharacterized protein|uniref:DUF503 domain-containing protein n=1 Tax=Bacillaceae TaxID=186817 RepID=UPI0005A42E65|nr:MULTISPECIES: DUF503 family protein [Bacillaceae]MCB5934074.1 DUF503 family protein [Bacillus sp. DFI.2.34]AWI12191.1 DUF503 domain-containing protein [Caldibacillus thermoamylovorans]KIO58967.1 hypothetical protein B4065_0788 [Caldibacillus thermoamylovorans]KIO61801.1 hypothetical protein B4064_0741 [Caldibacillus thermoamylovorans]MCB7075226.1 DUF503 family protein [Caldibacillus thermoamylovorans]